MEPGEAFARSSRVSCRLSKVCPFGGNLVYVGSVNDSQPPFQDATAEAKRQRAKDRLYVLCQLLGWGAFVSLQLVFVLLLRDSSEVSYSSMDMVHLVAIGLQGLLVSHFSRPYVHRWGLKNMGWKRLAPRILGLALVLSIVWTIISYGWHYGILRETYPDKLNPFVLMGISIFNGTLIYLTWFVIYFAYHVFDRFNRSELERLRLAAVVKDAELRALKSQVNPHFIFNSLNSVRALIDEDPQRARSAVTQLANMLRYSLQSGMKGTVSFEDELAVVNDYLALEQVRHEERLRLKLNISPSALHRMIPPMLLQTLVENAVKYGISTRPEGGEIAIDATIEENDLVIDVRNPGHLKNRPQKDAAEGRSTGVGLRNALDRLHLLCGGTARIYLVQSGPNEVTATVVIPEARITEPPPTSPSSRSLPARGSLNPAVSP